MSDSSNLSEEGTSDSLDTMIGFSTETGGTRAVASSSFSEDQPLSDPTLASSDSSRPITPRPEEDGQFQNGGASRGPPRVPAPSGGSPEEPSPAAAAASRPVAGDSQGA